MKTQGAPGTPGKAGPAAARPWYREPWPWVLIAIPLAAVVASAITLWLAVSHPDRPVVSPGQYEAISSGLRAQDAGSGRAEDAKSSSDPDDNER